MVNRRHLKNALPCQFEAGHLKNHGDRLHHKDEANNDKVLSELEGIPFERRGAQFNCYLCLSDPSGKVRLEDSAICRGVVAEQRNGTAAFGYDPLFIIPEYHRTFGELNLAVKRAISHRSRALRSFIPRLLRLVSDESTT